MKMLSRLVFSSLITTATNLRGTSATEKYSLLSHHFTLRIPAYTERGGGGIEEEFEREREKEGVYRLPFANLALTQWMSCNVRYMYLFIFILLFARTLKRKFPVAEHNIKKKKEAMKE